MICAPAVPSIEPTKSPSPKPVSPAPSLTSPKPLSPAPLNGGSAALSDPPHELDEQQVQPGSESSPPKTKAGKTTRLQAQNKRNRSTAIDDLPTPAPTGGRKKKKLSRAKQVIAACEAEEASDDMKVQPGVEVCDQQQVVDA